MLVYPLHIHGDMPEGPADIGSALLDAFSESIYICILVLLMMTLIEIFNVTTQGRLFRGLERHSVGQIVVASALGLMPGCLGGFAGVSLYTHRMIGFGALVAMLIATTGDEAFLMLAMFPGKALMLSCGLFVLAIAAGVATDLAMKAMHRRVRMPDIDAVIQSDDNYEIHPCDCGHDHSHHDERQHNHGHAHSRILHFLKAHVWRHVIKRHLPVIFAWTFSVLALFGVLSVYIDLETWIRGNVWVMILVAAVIGLIPESGPHMIFVSMFASGILPFPVLLASCIAQDGHACLPLIAEDKRSWLYVRFLKSGLAVAAGFIAMLF